MNHESKKTDEAMKTATDAQGLSKYLFNAQHRLSVAAVFAPPMNDALTHSEVAKKSSVSTSVAHKELAVLVRIEALQRVEAGRQVHYQRIDCPFWPLLVHLLELT